MTAAKAGRRSSSAARRDHDVYAAAATFLPRLAIAADRIIPTEIGRRRILSRAARRSFVGALDQFSAPTLAAIGVDEAARKHLGAPGPRRAVRPARSNSIPPRRRQRRLATATATEGVYDRWQNELVNPSGMRGGWFAFENWLERTFDLSFSSLERDRRDRGGPSRRRTAPSLSSSPRRPLSRRSILDAGRRADGG